MEQVPLLEARGIAKSFGAVVALRSADLVVMPGEVHALLGANGAGKSTLVKILSGVFPADSGSVQVNGVEARIGSPVDAMASGLATVFQDPALIPDLTIEQNFRLTDVDLDVVRGWLDQMEVENIDFGRLVKGMPLETLRLLDLARALAHDPQLLLLDEITAALPADHAEKVFDVMDKLTAMGRSVLFITHRLAEVLRVCDRATVLRDGRKVAEVEPKAKGEAALLEAMVGKEVKAEYQDPEQRVVPADAPVALEAIDLHSRGKVNGASLSVRAGEILGIAALEGQGQDRLFELLSGDRQPESGEILVHGEPMRARSPFDAIARGVVSVPADRLHALLPQRSVRENLTVPLYNRVRHWFGLARNEKERAASAVDRLDIDTRAQSQVRRLSGGNQQKVVLGRWLASGFNTLLCFDPTRGIDIQTKRQIYDLLRELADQGNAIVLYTSELPEIPLVCDRVLVLYNGEVVHSQDAYSATEEKLLSAAHGLAGAS
ncbi:MAG TPA: sugar ABC transporter ATP-binding protein [Acidimicrobiia bacterium]|nr:sugar ABC transporter ATP-binding protein [Acidimicrobiia bacterium]